MTTLTLRQAGLACYAARWSHQKDGDRSFRNYERAVEDSDNTLSMDSPVTEVTSLDLRLASAALLDGGLSPATVNRRMAAVCAVLDTAVEAGALTSAPRYRRLSESEGRTRVLTRGEITALEGFLLGDSACLVRVLWSTGMRVSEALNLEWGDIDQTNGLVHIRDSKSGRPRVVPFMDNIFEDCSGRRGPFSALSRSVFSREWRRARNLTGLGPDVVPHTLRHSFATRLVEQGTPLHVVSKLLGHTSISTTMRYAHAADDSLRKAIEQLGGGEDR